MGSSDGSTPAKGPLGVPRLTKEGVTKRAASQPTDDDPPLAQGSKIKANRTVAIGETKAETSKKPIKASPHPRQASPRARMPTLPGGIDVQTVKSVTGPSDAPPAKSVAPPPAKARERVSGASQRPPGVSQRPPLASRQPPGVSHPPSESSEASDERRKLNPVPLPWQRPEERAPKPDPAVLLVGADEKFLPAIEKSLAGHRVFVETTDLGTIVETVVAAAPDLVMLMGDAARDCGNEVLRKLSESPQSAVVPVVILDDDTALDARLRAFRHGAAAIIPRSASVDAIADQVAKLAREIPERHGAALGEVGDTTLNELVETLAKQLRSGILSVSAGQGSDAEAVRLVLGQGRPLAELIDDFVKRARKHVLAAEPLHYEFDEHVSGTVQMLDVGRSESGKAPEDLSDVRIALADSDAARADNIAQELRSLGATVVVTDLSPSDGRFMRMRQVDPTILLIGEAHVQGEGYDLVRRMRQDTRLRWASLLVVRWAELWSEQDAAPKMAVQRLAGTLAALSEPENSVRERARETRRFDTRLEIVGPARCLRALTASNSSLRAVVSNLRLRVEVDVGNKLVVGATATSEGGLERFEGATALAALLQLSSGRVSIEPVQNPATANVMTTIDVALNMADAEPPPIAPSLPAAPSDSAAASVRPAPMPVPDLTLAPVQAHPADATAPEPGRAASDERISRLSSQDIARSQSLARGIRPMTALLLVGLAAMQGLLIVVLWHFFSAKDARQAAPTAAAPALTLPVAQPAPKPIPALREAPAAVAPPAAPRPVSAAIGFPEDDASTNKAPTCEQLWAEHPSRAGSYPGAAYEQAQQANKWITRGDLDQAELAYCLAARWDDQNIGYHVGLAHVFLMRRDGKQAVPVLEKALKLNSESTRALSLLGDAFARIGKYDEARRHWLRANGRAPDDTRALAGLGQRDLQQGITHLKRLELIQAERLLRRAVLCDPKNVQAVVGLSRALTALEDPEPALTWAKYAVSLDARGAPARIALGDALAKMGDQAGARVEWREAQLLDPTDETARRRMRGE